VTRFKETPSISPNQLLGREYKTHKTPGLL